LQLTLKKNNVNSLKKHDEAIRLQVSYEVQAQSLISDLYRDSIVIWKVIFEEDNNIEPYLSINTDFPKTKNEKIIDFVQQNRLNVIEIVDSNFGAQPTLSLDGMLFIMMHFNFLWSFEHCELFTQIVTQSSQSLAAKFCSCLIIQPLIRIYFITSLKPVFSALQSGKEEELLNILQESLIKFSPLLPGFSKRCILHVDSPKSIFWEHLLLPILKGYYLFDLAPHEFLVFFQFEYEAMINNIKEFFESDEADELLRNICMCKDDISVLPKEQLLMEINPDYYPHTLIDKSILERVHGKNEAINSLPSNLVFCPISRNKIDKYEAGMTNSFGLVANARNFLLHAELIKIRSECHNPIEFFRELADLSSVYGDPDLEDILSLLTLELRSESSITIDSLCDLIEKDVQQEQSNNPLWVLSGYSSQTSYISKLREINSNLCKSVKVWIEYQKITKFAQNLIDQKIVPIPPPEIIKGDPQQFLDFYDKASNLLTTEGGIKLSHSTNRILFTLLSYHLGVFSLLETNTDTQNLDSKIQDYVRLNSTELISSHQQSFLNIYKEDPKKLSLFYEDFDIAFKSQMMFERISHIHTAFQILTGLLQIQNIGEIGADQIVPFAMIATVYANPPKLATTATFMSKFIVPLMTGASPLDHAEEYSLIQFLSCYKYIEEKMNQI